MEELEGLLVTRPHILLARQVRLEVGLEVGLSEDSRLEVLRLILRLENLLAWCLAPVLITSGVRAVTGRSYTVSGGNSSTCRVIEIKVTALTWGENG